MAHVASGTTGSSSPAVAGETFGESAPSASAPAIASAAEEPLAYRWVILGVLWVTYVVVFLSRLSVGPLAPFFKSELSITSAQVGLVMSAAAFGYTLTGIPLGWVVDRFGARWPILLGEVIAGLGMLAVAWSSSYASLLGFMLLTGMGCGFLMPATTQAVVVWFSRRERATVMGVKQTAVNMGGIIGAAVLPIIAIRFGWRAGFMSLGCVALLVGVISWFLYRDPPARTDDGITKRQPGVPLSELLRNRNIWLVAIAGLCMNWVEMAMIGHLVLYMKEALLFPVVAAGAMLATAETAGAIARPASGVVSDWLFGGLRRPVFLIFAVTATVMCAVFALYGRHLGWLLFPAIFTLGVGSIGFGAIFVTMLSEFGGRRGAGTASALGNAISMAGSIFGPVAFGHIVDITRSYDVAWWSQTLMGSLAIAALLAVRETRRDA